jgi:Ubiquitin family
MQIRLKTINGEEFRMEIEKSSQVTQFRQEVGLKLNVDSERVRLIFAGQVLSDADSFGKYEMPDESVIHAVIRPVTSVPSAATPAHSNSDASRDQPSFTFSSGVIGSQPSNMRGSSSVTGTGPRPTMSPQEMEFANGIGRFMVGSMSMSMEEMGGEGISSNGGPPNMDAIMSDIFGRSMTEAMNSSNDTTGRSRMPTGNPSHGRISVLRAKESFGTSIESGLSSIRIISEGLRRGTTSLPPAFEEIEPREEDPSMAVAQMLSELGTTLSALKVPVMKMSKEMQTGSFTQQCPTASQRINKLTEITNLKTTLQNLTNASQHAARALALLTLESVPGMQPPLRTARSFAAAAAANAVATAAAASAAAASAPASVATDTTAKPAATPANSTKLATGFLNSKPVKKVPTPSPLIEGQKIGADCDNTTSEAAGKSGGPAAASMSNTNNQSKPKPVAVPPSRGGQGQTTQQQQQRGSSGCPFPLPVPSPFCPFHSGQLDDDSKYDSDDADEEHARMAFIHMLRNSGPAGEFHLAMMMKGAQEREAEERKQAKAAKWVAVKAKKVAEAKRKSDLADAAKAAADKTAATGVVEGKEGSGPSPTLPAASKATAFSTGVKLPDLIPVSGSLSTSGDALGSSQLVFSSTPAVGSSAKGKVPKANWVPRGRRSSDAAVTQKERKYNAARPMPQTSYVPSPALLLSSVGTELLSTSDTLTPPLSLLFPESVSDTATNPTSLKLPSGDAALSFIVTNTPQPSQGSAESIHPVDMMSFTASISTTPLTPLRLSIDQGPHAVPVAVAAPADYPPSSAAISTVALGISGKSDGEAALAPAPALSAPPLSTTEPLSQRTSFVASASASAPLLASESASDTAPAVPAGASARQTVSSAILLAGLREGDIEAEEEVEAVITSNSAEALVGGETAPDVPIVSWVDSAKGVQSCVGSDGITDSGSGTGSGSDAAERNGVARAREAVGASINGGRQVLVASPSSAPLTDTAVTAQPGVVCVDTVHRPSTVSENAAAVVQCVAASEPSSDPASDTLHSLPLPSTPPAPAVVVSDTPVTPSKGPGGCTQQ